MMDAITVGKWQGKLMLVFSCLDISLNSRELWQNTDFLTRKFFYVLVLLKLSFVNYKISINLSKARRRFSWGIFDWNCTTRTPKFTPFTSLFSDVCLDHDMEETVLGLNPGTLDLNLGRGKKERELFINVKYHEVLFSFLCKVKKKLKKQNKTKTKPKQTTTNLLELPYRVGK